MHFHLPKPLHGWRAFAGEVGIIVVGVLIALGAQQVVEAVHDRSTADETRAAVKAEFNDDLAALVVRQSIEPCIDRMLDELRALLADWERTGHFKTPQWVAQTPGTGFALTRYEAAVSAGRLALLPSEEQYRMGAVASGLRLFEGIQADERQVWGRLRALQAGSSILSAGDRPLLRIALQDASELDYRAKLAVRQEMPQAREFGYRPDFTNFRRTIGRVVHAGGYHPSICTPIDTPRELANRTQVVPLPL